MPGLSAHRLKCALHCTVPYPYLAHSVSRFLAIVEDIASIVAEAVPAATVRALIDQTGGKQLVGAHLFDPYRCDQVGAGKKSLAYRLSYQSKERSLTDKDAAKLRIKIVKRLEREVGAVLREG